MTLEIVIISREGEVDSLLPYGFEILGIFFPPESSFGVFRDMP